MQDVKWNMDNIATLDEAAGQFRDQIWAMVEDWMLHLHKEPGDKNWKRIPETQLVDNLPTLLRGVSKVIESPDRMADFEAGGIIYESAAELGRNRRANNFTPSELFHEQEVLRDVVWKFCRDSFTALDFYDLEERVNRALDKMVSTVNDSYVGVYAAELKYLARHDKSTGFLNYEAFKDEISKELRRSRRYRHSFALIMLDIDGFGAYTESFGHAAADLLIQEVARTVAQSIRTVDMPARYGTDQFAIILPETGKKQARKVAERLRRAVKLETRHSAEVRGDLKAAVTISIGISAYPKDAETVDEVISLADEALFEAKKAGRDVVIWN